MKTIIGIILPTLALALAGCEAGGPSGGPVSSVSSASCAYVTENTLIVKATGSVCDSLQSGLAQNGDYWAPFYRHGQRGPVLHALQRRQHYHRVPNTKTTPSRVV
jgi:hypothetical protein